VNFVRISVFNFLMYTFVFVTFVVFLFLVLILILLCFRAINYFFFSFWISHRRLPYLIITGYFSLQIRSGRIYMRVKCALFTKNKSILFADDKLYSSPQQSGSDVDFFMQQVPPLSHFLLQMMHL